MAWGLGSLVVLVVLQEVDPKSPEWLQMFVVERQ